MSWAKITQPLKKGTNRQVQENMGPISIITGGPSHGQPNSHSY